MLEPVLDLSLGDQRGNIRIGRRITLLVPIVRRSFDVKLARQFGRLCPSYSTFTISSAMRPASNSVAALLPRNSYFKWARSAKACS